MPLMQIIRGRDYSCSVKNYGDFLCQFPEKNQNSPLRPFPGSKSRDAFQLLGIIG